MESNAQPNSIGMASPPPTGYKVELYFSCKKLKDLDLLSKSDPQIVVFIKQGNQTQWVKVGETEVMKNNLNPEFKTAITLFYQFEVHQHLRIEVQDYDSPGKFDLIGSIETTVGNIVGSKDFTFNADLHKND